MTEARQARSVAIVGGGLTGAAIAYHVARRSTPDEVKVLVFEPRAELGAGVAYGTTDPAHRINVPAAKMSLIPGDDEHFVRWLAENGEAWDDPEAGRPDGRVFPRRSVFGRYVASYVMPLVASGRIRHVADNVEAVGRDGDHWTLETSGGLRLGADIVTIATSHPPPSPPDALTSALFGHARFVPDPNAADALAAIRPDDRVLIVGNGLTGADVVASLDLAGHVGPIMAISRRGLRSRGHAPRTMEAFGDFSTDPPATALALLRRVRQTIEEAIAAGLTWHPVLDAAREQGGTLWRALPVGERRRLVRHLRPFWDVHRFRVAPQVETVLDRKIAEGRLEILAASIVEVTVVEDAIAITIRRRATGERMSRRFDAVVAATGPAHGGILGNQPYLAALAATGLVQIDPTGLGLLCDDRGRAIGTDGAPEQTLIVAGPLARGTFGELMGLPQVTDYAAFVADEILAMGPGPRAAA